MGFEDFWYVAAESWELEPGKVLARQILGQWLALFRNQQGQVIALQDSCLHRQGRLSCGRIQRGQLHCPYHGWVYGDRGQVVTIPAEGPQFQPRPELKTHHYGTQEQEGFIYVCLGNPGQPPFGQPHYNQPGWQRIRVQHRFANNVTNCVENFIDIPHTAVVHPGLFRTSQRQAITMTVTREGGEVIAQYQNEDQNLGWWGRFLNPQGQAIYHQDRFILPNVTTVEYKFAPRRQLAITSQSVPVTATETLVYTDVAFNYGLWNRLAAPFVRWTTKRIIAQDLVVLAGQQQVMGKYGQHFHHTPADTIHTLVESIRLAIARGEDPRQLPAKTVTVQFWV